jgi:single-strand DNA-binding protein
MNKAILIGTVDNDPAVKTVGRSQLASFKVATHESWRGKDGQQQDRTDWHRVAAWGQLADVAGRLQRGQLVVIEGKIKTRSYDGKDGTKQYITEIAADSIIVAPDVGDEPVDQHPSSDELPF